jgi:hypothetical protein
MTSNTKHVEMRPVRRANAEYRVREHLTEKEINALLDASSGIAMVRGIGSSGS